MFESLMRKLRAIFIYLMVFCLLGCRSSDHCHYQGYVEASLLFLASPYSGVLVVKSVNRGQTVKKGQGLFALDNNPEVLLVDQVKAELLQAQHVLQDLKQARRPPEIAAIQAQINQTDATLRLAALRIKRNTLLYTKNAIDRDSVDAAEAKKDELQYVKAQFEANMQLAHLGSREEQVKAQQAQVQSLLAKVQQVSWQLAQKRVASPAAGIIFDTYFMQGEFVPAQQPIASLLEPDAIRIEFFVPVRALSQLFLGQSIAFTCEGCATQNEALVQYISPTAEYIPPLVYSNENTDKLVFRVKARPKYPTQYKPGQPVVVTSLHHAL